MRIIKRPGQYTLLATLVLLGIPITILNCWVLQKGPLVKLFRSDKGIIIAAVSAALLLTYYWLMKVKRRGFFLFLALSATVLFGNLYFLITTKNYALAFYALFLLIISILYSLHLYKSLHEAYYQSGQRWFEGKPKFLPQIMAEVQVGDTMVSGRLSKLQAEGCYVFFNGAGSDSDKTLSSKIDQADKILIKLKEMRLECPIELVSKSNDGEGRGLRFMISSADQQKDIRDFIERLRSSGYVA